MKHEQIHYPQWPSTDWNWICINCYFSHRTFAFRWYCSWRFALEDLHRNQFWSHTLKMGFVNAISSLINSPNLLWIHQGPCNFWWWRATVLPNARCELVIFVSNIFSPSTSRFCFSANPLTITRPGTARIGEDSLAVCTSSCATAPKMRLAAVFFWGIVVLQSCWDMLNHDYHIAGHMFHKILFIVLHYESFINFIQFCFIGSSMLFNLTFCILYFCIQLSLWQSLFVSIIL